MGDLILVVPKGDADNTGIGKRLAALTQWYEGKGYRVRRMTLASKWRVWPALHVLKSGDMVVHQGVWDLMAGTFMSWRRRMPWHMGMFYSAAARACLVRFVGGGGKIVVHTYRGSLLLPIGLEASFDLCEEIGLTYLDRADYLSRSGRAVAAALFRFEGKRTQALENRLADNGAFTVISDYEYPFATGKRQVVKNLQPFYAPPSISLQNVHLHVYFMGPSKYFPNMDAAERLALGKQHPDNFDIGLTIIGNGHERSRQLSQYATGYVHDLQSLVEVGGFGWAVLRYGRGVQNKVADYAGLGLLPIMTRRVAEPYGFKGLVEAYLVVETVHEGLNTARSLAMDPELYQSIYNELVLHLAGYWSIGR